MRAKRDEQGEDKAYRNDDDRQLNREHQPGEQRSKITKRDLEVENFHCGNSAEGSKSPQVLRPSVIRPVQGLSLYMTRLRSLSP